MFRTIETVGGTTLMDEADPDETEVGTDLMKILNCGYQQGLTIVRNDKDRSGNWCPSSFDVFGPKIISGRKRFQDEATESRCLSHMPLPSVL